MWAIRNKRTHKFVYGTDFRYSPRRQFTSDERALLFETEEDAKREFNHRRCGKDYQVVPVRLEVLE